MVLNYTGLPAVLRRCCELLQSDPTENGELIETGRIDIVELQNDNNVQSYKPETRKLHERLEKNGDKGSGLFCGLNRNS